MPAVFFKNPIINATQLQSLQSAYKDIPHYPQADGRHKISAAWLIDQCGLKGHKQNNVGISPDHALVLVNYGSNDGHDLLTLAKLIIDTVNAKFNVALQNEVTIL